MPNKTMWMTGLTVVAVLIVAKQLGPRLGINVL